MLYDASRVGNLSPNWFDPKYWSARGELDGVARGRGATHFVRSAGKRYVLRHYRRGGLIARISGDRYVWQGEQSTRPFEEWQLTYRLHRAGLPVAAPLAANALLMAYIGGSAVFGGPILGAVLIKLLQSGVSLLSNSWLVYVGVLFITMVIFAPNGITGLVLAHRPIARAGQLGALALPYLRVSVPGLLMVLGFVGLVELTSFLILVAILGAIVLAQREN